MGIQALTRSPFVPGIMGAVVALALLVAPVASAYNIQCAGNPPPPHVNGLGQTFDDCAPLGVPGNTSTYSLTLATNARAAWPNAGTDLAATCAGGALAVYRQTPTSCAVWGYTKTIAGHVHLEAASNACYCPSLTDPVWK